MTDPLLCGLCVGLCLGMTAAIGLMALARWREDRERRLLHVCPFCGSFICVETVREDVSPRPLRSWYRAVAVRVP